MQYITFLLAAYLMGCLAAIPTGPVQIEVVRRSLTGHLMPSLAVVVGAFAVDVLYGVIAFFGIAPFLREPGVMAIFWLFGGSLLTALGIYVIAKTLKQREIGYTDGRTMRKRWGFLGGLTLSATNPVMIIWWLSGAQIFRDVGLIKDFSSEVAVSFLMAGSLGLASYLTALSLFIFWAKEFISPKRVRQINLFFGAFLLLLAAYFLFTSLRSLLR